MHSGELPLLYILAPTNYSLARLAHRARFADPEAVDEQLRGLLHRESGWFRVAKVRKQE